MNKSSVLLFDVFAVSSPTVVKPARAESIPKPSVSKLTLKHVTSPYRNLVNSLIATVEKLTVKEKQGLSSLYSRFPRSSPKRK
jgi:hypothetical protein